VAAFNTHDLDHLLGCLSADTPWVTGSDRSRSIAELAKLFESAFTGLSPKLTSKNVVIDGDEVACELSEHLVVDGATASITSPAPFPASPRGVLRGDRRPGP